MSHDISPVLDSGARWQPPQSLPQACTPGYAPPPLSTSYRPEPTWHPQLQVPTRSATPPSAADGPYGIPSGQTLAEVAGGTQAQPFDVTLSQLATAVYGTRGDPPEGWNSVTDAQLQEMGVQDPQAWRLQYLGANDAVASNAQEFLADIYTDGQGNYVLSYRGTAEKGPDWDNNFRQGLGYETRDGDKFSVTAVNTAVEFARVFGDPPGGNATNLAITGHSQGGGLASVGSLASGIPAVTFDASGIHPNTFDRIGIDPQRARDLAEGGQIRAYSLSSDALTNVQDSWVTGVLAPDAIGTQIVVKPASADEHHMFTHYGPIEGFTPGQSQQINTATEIGRHTPFLPINPVTGTITGIANLGGNLAYAAISHSPNALTAGMVEHQPWQPGYENPSNFGRDVQNLLPDVVKDDYARNVHDFATDIDAVVSNEFADGRYVQGGVSLTGDFVEGAFNSAGDTFDGYADTLAGDIDANIDGWVGDVLTGAVDGGGDVVEFVADAGGQVVETVADGVGWLAQGATDAATGVGNFVGGLFR